MAYPATVNLEIVQNRTYNRTLTFTNLDGTALNVSTWVFSSDVRTVANDPTILASFVFSQAGLPTNQVRMTMDGLVTALLPVKEVTVPGTFPVNKLSYDIKVVANGAPITLQEGAILVTPSVTK